MQYNDKNEKYLHPIFEAWNIFYIIPTKNTPKVQECHITVGHIICDLVEKKIFEER